MMTGMSSVKIRLLPLLCVLFALVSLAHAAPELVVEPTPDGGLQPRLVVDESGSVHLLYFKKRIDRPGAREGNLYYRQYQADAGRWGNPVKVSSSAFNLQTVSIARAAMAVDAQGRVHVVWYQPSAAQYLYARSDENRTTFGTQQSMVKQFIEGHDAGADIAALGSQVAIVWGAGDLTREYERTVYARLSTDYGASFGPEMAVGNPDLGACACCSLAAEYGDEQSLRIAYRSAINGVGRHMQLLTLALADGQVIQGNYGAVHELQQWELSACPLSTNDIGLNQGDEHWLVFETAARIVQTQLGADTIPSLVAAPFIETRQKNPAVAFNGLGQRLIVWGEGISHSRGGRLNVQLFAADGAALESGFNATIEIPDFSFPAAALLPDGSFLVLY